MATRKSPKAKATQLTLVKAQNVKHNTREQWLKAFAAATVHKHTKLFEKLNMDDVRIGVGFPSGGARSKRVEGQAFIREASADATYEIIVNVRSANTREVATTVAHELCHVADYNDGSKPNHGPSFARYALAIGLGRPMKSTPPTDEFWAWADPILERMGDYPHASLAPNTTKKQTTRLIKAECNSCGFVFRTTVKWIRAVTILRCPDYDCEGLINTY